jgi:hypothetical protein
MKNILNFIDKWGGRISFLLIVIVFFKTCTTNSKLERVEKNMVYHIQSIDSTVNTINLKTISADDMEELIKETPFWKSLELEELSDKNRIPINKLKNEYEVN